MIVDVLHPGRANVAKKELQDVIGGMFKVDSKLVILFGFRTKFGGGKSTGFCLIYDSEESMRKFEPKYRLIRHGFGERVEKWYRGIRCET
jgi:small subunit ribosomal protein S24e